LAATGVLMMFLVVFFLNTTVFSSEEKQLTVTPNLEMIAQAEQLVKVGAHPPIDYSFDLMTEGVLQHLDREYTYDVIPASMQGGFLFQGIHRPPMGTVIVMEVLKPSTISFFFHSKVDGGYSQIFENLDGWEKMDTAPQYDIHNGNHGLDMTLYQKNVQPGIYSIPATTKDRACFSIVFQGK